MALLERVEREQAAGVQVPWIADYMAGVRERAASSALEPALPVVAAARRLAKSPTWSVAGEAYWERKAAVDELRRALAAYDEATK